MVLHIPTWNPRCCPRQQAVVLCCRGPSSPRTDVSDSKPQPSQSNHWHSSTRVNVPAQAWKHNKAKRIWWRIFKANSKMLRNMCIFSYLLVSSLMSLMTFYRDCLKKTVSWIQLAFRAKVPAPNKATGTRSEQGAVSWVCRCLRFWLSMIKRLTARLQTRKLDI